VSSWLLEMVRLFAQENGNESSQPEQESGHAEDPAAASGEPGPRHTRTTGARKAHWLIHERT